MSSSSSYPLLDQSPIMTTPNLAAPPAGYTTIPSPSTPSTALPPTARPMLTATQQSIPTTTAMPARVYQLERTRRGRMFPDEMVRERMQQMCYRARIPPPDSLRPAQYADATVTEYLRQLIDDASKIKDHRVMNTFPRDAPTWKHALIVEAREALGNDPAQDSETPMWDLEFIDSPWADAQAYFKSIAAQDQEWRRQAKSTRIDTEARWKEDVKPGTINETPIPGTPGPASEAHATPSAAVTTAATPASSEDPLVAPGSLNSKKKPGASRPPTLSKAAQQANARKLEEQRSAQQMTQELTRSMGRKRKAWMMGGAATPSAASPSVDLMNKKKRRIDEASELTGSPAKAGSASIPGSPLPLGKRPPAVAIPSGLNPYAKRVQPVEEPAVAAKSESGTPAPETPPSPTAPPASVLQFPEIPDSLTVHDIKSAYDRRLRHGGPFRRVMEQRYELLLLDCAKRENVAWQNTHAGGLAAAAREQAKKEAKGPAAGLLGIRGLGGKPR